ncbi:hypothetical protein ACJ41O_014426 [Fusarium nematophilum]
MGRVKSAAAALRLGCQRSVEKESNIVNNELVLKKLQPAVKRNYEKMMQLWDEYQKQHPEASPYELISLKDFIRKFAYSIDGEEGVDVPGSETVRKQWNAFTAAWQRKDPEQPIPRGIAASVTQFINGPLAEEMGMPKTKRPRRFATKNVMLNFARQLWAADWVEFKRPATVVDDWGLLLGNAYSSSRIGEYIESSCRSGTGRGLYFKDLTFVVFINEAGAPEFAIQLTRDAKNMTCTPDKRSQANDEIETAGAFSHRLRLLGLRAGYATPPRNHDIRAEGLHLMNQFESEATRMVYAGHTDPNTVPRHYLPRNGADGQAAYHSQERRALVLDLFRGLTIPRNPSLWHCLPAKKQFECENCPDIIDINEALYTRRGKTDSKSLEERKKLYAEKRKLFAKQLRDWQKSQPVKHDDPPGYHRAIFDRIRFLMPERDRLARNIFEVDVLRSSTGLAVLNDMLALYQKSSNVECRPGLELDRCQCGKGNDRPYEWRHVYECYKAAASKVHGFSELCFLMKSERSTSLVLPCISQESPASLATEYEEAAPSGYSTPLSSAPSEEVIDPAILPAGTGVDDRAMDRTVPNESYEAAPGILHESQGASQGSFSAVSIVTEKEKEAAAVKPKIDLIQTTTDQSLLYGDLQQERYDDARKYDTSLFLDMEENEFEVESLVAKGRIGRRVWYKVKWKGYPEADNSWVKKKDIGTGAIANYESRHPQGQGEFKFEKLVAKREWDGITLYEAKWHGQLESENIWVDKWDIGAKVVATFEIDLSRED